MHSSRLCLLFAVLAMVLAVSGLAATTAVPAAAEPNGVGATPAMGWSSWSFIRHDPTAASIEAQAAAMASSGLVSAGYDYVNIDDFWYDCPGSQGPDVDSNGRWVTNASEFPPSSSGENGIAVVATYVHSHGLKFGLYVTPGISKQAVRENTPIAGTSYTADEIATTTSESNYNCGGTVGINYSAPGAQDFINSWADEFASWGVDYIKLDGVGDSDVGDVEAAPAGTSSATVAPVARATRSPTGPTSSRASPRSRSGSPTAGRARSTTTTRSRSATGRRTTGSRTPKRSPS